MSSEIITSTSIENVSDEERNEFLTINNDRGFEEKIDADNTPQEVARRAFKLISHQMPVEHNID